MAVITQVPILVTAFFFCLSHVYFKVTVNSLLMNIHDFSYNDFCETINAMREI